MIIGHQKIVNLLEKSVEKCNVAHAYLFSGPDRVGKFTLAKKFANILIEPKDDKINPDLIVISPPQEEKSGIIKEKDIKIETIRELERELSLSPYFGKRKVAILNDAERLTVAAQNALLKTLEEPQENRVIILVANDARSILPTIRSRSVNIKFSLVHDSEIAQMVPFGAKKEEVIFWAMGRPGIATELISNPEMLEEKRKTSDEFQSLFRGNLTDRFRVAEELSKDKKKIIKKINIWTAILRTVILGKGNGLALAPSSALSLLEDMEKSQTLIQKTNANPKTVLENLFLKF